MEEIINILDLSLLGFNEKLDQQPRTVTHVRSEQVGYLQHWSRTARQLSQMINQKRYDL